LTASASAPNIGAMVTRYVEPHSARFIQERVDGVHFTMMKHSPVLETQ